MQKAAKVVLCCEKRKEEDGIAMDLMTGGTTVASNV